VLEIIAEFIRELIVAGTRDGLEAARARGRTGGQKPKLTPRQAKIAQAMYEETGPDGRHVHTVAQIAAEFGVTAPPSTATSTKPPANRHGSLALVLG
jgi:DNA invertase Pin-like site-specific DNA recombinase